MKRAVTVVVTAALLAGCGSDDDGENGDTVAETTPDTSVQTAAPAPDTAVFRADGVGFTFEYPKEYVRGEPAGALGQVSPERGEFFNAIKVRQAADRELRPERYLEDFRRDFARRVGRVELRIETIGDLEAGVLEFRDSDRARGKRTDFTSTSYFFTGAGRTWQLECVAEAEQREEIEAACQRALESIEFTD